MDLPDNLRGPDISSDENRQTKICDNSLENFIENDVNTQMDTEIVHIGRRSQNECAVMVNTGKRSFKALWDSGAGRCVFHMSATTKFHQNSNLISSRVTLD